MFPTHKPIFLDPLQPGPGFPFDRMQNSLVPTGTPLLITHESRDRLWALVETDWVAGWARRQDIAVVDPEFMTVYSAHPLSGFLADQVPIFRPTRPVLFSGRVGMALPMVESRSDHNDAAILVPARNHLGNGEILEARVPQKTFQPLPFPATFDNFVRILNVMMGQTYGWGGMYENWDCSTLIQDLFAGFCIPLPRNSRDQAESEDLISLKGLPGQKKQNLIRTQAVPLLTLLYMPGHIMLYLGQDPTSDRPVTCHAMWGVTTRPFFRTQTGRRILGRTVITSLEPGKELFTLLVRPKDLLVEKLTRMVRLN